MGTHEKNRLIVRSVLILTMIALAAALRVVPHPWNLTPVGAMALFSGAMVRDRRLAFLVPVLALLAGDILVGFHALMVVVYASYLVNVALGFWLRNRRSVGRIAGLTALGAVQFFVVTNFAVWASGISYERTATGLVSCYVAGVPYFWNTLAGDALYATLLFGGFALAERFFPALRQPTAAS
jgi:hypothetical protein